MLITPPPAYARGYYTKAIEWQGIYVLANDEVPDEAVARAAEIVFNSIANNPVLIQRLAADGGRFVIIPQGVMITDLPDYDDLDPAQWGQYRGLGAVPGFPASSAGEENILAFPGDPNDPYRGEESITLHEWLHAIEGLGLIDGHPTLHAAFMDAYDAAKTAGLWANTYALDTFYEYFAETAQAYFDDNPERADNSDGIHNQINTRAELEAYDPVAFDLLKQIFGDNGWRPGGFFGGSDGDVFDTGSAGNDIVFGNGGDDTIDGAGGADYLLGGDGNDELVGDLGDDKLDGGNDHDDLNGGAGDDTIDGGSGADTAFLGGSWFEYHVTVTAGVYTSVDKRAGAPSGTDTLRNVEQVSFANGQFDIADTLRDAPVATEMAAKTATEDVAFSFGASAHFSDADAPLGDRLTFSLTNAPSWLKINATTGLVSRTPDGGDVAPAISVTVTATDLHGLAASRGFSLVVQAVDAPEPPGPINGTPGRNVLTGTSGPDTINGLGGKDTLFGKAGADRLDGGGGKDVLVGGSGADALVGGKGSDTASYQDASAKVTAHLKKPSKNKGDARGDTYDSIERLTGSRHDDRLVGDDGANTIKGGDGDDRIQGGKGADVLSGNGGADQFLFTALVDSTVSAAGRDVIRDFSRTQDDRIDLSAIDARAGSKKNHAFVFIGRDEFTGAKGELQVSGGSKRTIVSGDVTGDGLADFSIELPGRVDLTAGDFAL